MAKFGLIKVQGVSEGVLRFDALGFQAVRESGLGFRVYRIYRAYRA